MTVHSRVAARIALVAGFLGGLAVVVAWLGASSSPIVRDQAAWGAVGVSGTFGVIGASVLWVVTLRQAVRLRTAALRTEIASGPARSAAAGAAVVRRDAETVSDAVQPQLVAAATMVHYHRADCRLSAAKPVQPAGRAEHERAGRTPCGVCAP